MPFVGAVAGQGAAARPGRAPVPTSGAKPPPPPHSNASLPTARGTGGKFAPPVQQAVLHVFKAQPPAVQRQIVQAAARNPTHPASQALFGAKPTLDPVLAKIEGTRAAHVGGIGLGGALSGLAHIFSPSNVYGGGKSAGKSSGESGGGPGIGTVGMFGGLKSGAKVGENIGKDFVNLPAEAISTVGTVGGDVLSGHPGKAFGDLVNPYVQLAEHPAQAFYQHPLNSSLMALGLLHGATRFAAAPVRALAPESAAAKAIGTQREGVALTGNLTHERPRYSLSPSVKAGQKAAEATQYTRAPTGELVPRTPFLRQRLLNKNIGEIVGTRERIRRVNQEQVKASRDAAIRPSRVARVGHAAKTALAYGPQKAVISGAGVLARIADATIRRPDTVAEDLQKHLSQVSANRVNLLDEPQALKAHDAYVKQITKALQNKAFLRNPQAAFTAAERYAKEYAPVEARAASLGHFGPMDRAALDRRALMHYAVTHMDAKMDPELGLVDANGKQLSNAAILTHLKGPEGTGGRIPAYTPDRVRFDAKPNSSFYVSSERRPLPTTKSTTLYAYTHGLTDPSHLSLTEQHALMQGIVDSHHAQNTYLETLHNQLPGGGYGKTYAEAKARLAGSGLKPINIAQPFHPQESLDQAIQGLNPATAEEEAMRHSLDLNPRLQPSGSGGRWAGIDPHALRVLKQFENQISPNPLLRTIRGLNNQFRTVALSTSPKHIPGVTQENLIRDIANGVGFRSWLTGRRVIAKAEQMNPERGRELRTQLTGGQVAGMTEAGKTYRVSEHWAGTSAYPLLRAMEATFKAPGPRQLRTAWQAWTKFAIGGTKKVLEQQHQLAGLGKAALREHGYAEAARTDGFLGLTQRAFGLHGKMLDDAAKGLFDPAKARQMRATINQMYGKWTDLSPSAQTALMFSPFGLWWANSARFLARMPIDMPVKTSVLASATTGTEKERQAQGLDMFMPGALPGYEQGGIPVGGKVLAQNYYSPFGIANNPIETGQSLIQPWLTPIVTGSLGVDWLGKPLTSPGQNTNRGNEKTPNQAQRAQYIIDSVLASFLPLYTKAEQVTEGGASPYDVSGKGILPPLVTGHAPATKTPGKGLVAGLKKATLPVREYKIAAPTASSTAGKYLLGGSSTGSSSGGYLLGNSSNSSSGSNGGYLLP